MLICIYMLRFILLSSFCILSVHTGYTQDGDNTFKITGVVDTVPNTKYYIIYKEANTPLKRDTITLDEHSGFVLEGAITEPVRLFMEIKTDRATHLVGDYTAYQLWIDPGSNNSFFGNKDIYQTRRNFVMKGSPTDSIAHIFDLRLEAAKKEHSTATKDIYDSVRRSSIAEFPPSFFTLYLLREIVNKNNPDDIPFVSTHLNRFPESLLRTPTGLDIQARIRSLNELQLGKVLPNFHQSDTIGNLIELTAFRGKYVLIDFWASWCTPCRKEHPYLKQAYQRFRDSGFEILGISLDDTREDWLKAIHDDGLM